MIDTNFHGIMHFIDAIRTLQWTFVQHMFIPHSHLIMSLLMHFMENEILRKC